MSNKTIEHFISYLNASPVPFFAVKSAIEMLSDIGATHLSETENWNLESGKNYFVTRGDTALIAFRAGKNAASPFHIAAAHTDSPAMKIKPESEEYQSGALTVGVEVYGGPIISSWLDRELGIAGNAVIRTSDGFKSVGVLMDRPVAVIANAPIHLNREINKGFEYNAQKHLRAILKLGTEDPGRLFIRRLITDTLKCELSDIVSYDLFFYPFEKAALMGNNREIIASSRLDNLAMCHAILSAFVTGVTSDCTSLAVLFETEEIGSRSLGGADSSFLDTILERISLGLGGNREDFLRAKSGGFLMSTDMAHGFNPDYSEKYDSAHICSVNGGVVLKLNANMKYCTTSVTASRIRALCTNLNIPLQTQINRSDIPSGSTIGPISSSISGIPGADIGNPILAMHSIREFGGVKDHLDMIRLLTEFYSL
ncbi:M18 family aminopeptidase [Myxococcota bacterium]|nr:M18 family aminopeptidase [Myxococcota bacterium]MBU1379225.1 M18 family aminopeptidase [Myxococcota bacterium]MBU1496276.1 M18 family aminopeptidase [Myxococcota bacterium]